MRARLVITSSSSCGENGIDRDGPRLPTSREPLASEVTSFSIGGNTGSLTESHTADYYLVNESRLGPGKVATRRAKSPYSSEKPNIYL